MNNVADPPDVITYQREIARTQASITLPGPDGETQQIIGNWSAGDLQATRSLLVVLANQLATINGELQRREQQADVAVANMTQVRAQLQDALQRLTDQQAQLAAMARQVQVLKDTVHTKEREAAEILARVDSNTADLLRELAQLKVEASNGGRDVAVKKLAYDALIQRGEVISERYRLKARIERLEAENANLTTANEKLQSEIGKTVAAPDDEDDAWSNSEHVRAEWGIEHTLLDANGDNASTPFVIKVGRDRADALRRLGFYQAHLSEHSRVRLVIRMVSVGGWLEAQVS